MSNALSIAAVTAVIKDLLENGLVRDAIATSIGDTIVTALPPDRISVGGDERPQINLFLYQVTQNRNADWASGEFRVKKTRSIAEIRSSNPPLALNLHYLLTAYGAKDFQAELLLGYAMHLLHKNPVMSKDIVETSLQNASKVSTSSALSQALTLVSVPDLARQIGQIKICTEFFSMEDTSKLWSSLQTNYRPSAAYQVSSVSIDSNEDKFSDRLLPSFREPSIEQIIPPAETDGKLVTGSMLTIRGKRLRSDNSCIRIAGITKIIIPKNIQDNQISLPLPSGLAAGIHSLQVLHLFMGNPHAPADEIASNAIAFIVHPTISVTIDKVQQSEGNLYIAEITVKFNPLVIKGQRVILLLDEISEDRSTTYTIPVGSTEKDTDSIAIPVKNIKSGNYLVRVQVDGAESWISRSEDGGYDSQQVSIS
jgi:Pvc16 N-terminal domain